jgi:hypothetical protein
MDDKGTFKATVKPDEWKDFVIPNGFIAVFQTATFSLTIRMTSDAPATGDNLATKVTESMSA